MAAPGVIKSEANLVLVDVVVTDKKQHYLKDLTQKEFHVFEDGAEQPITSFSREADIQPGAPERQRYMVLFFDNAGLGPEGQMWEREAAAKFVQGTASPTRMMAVMDYGGILQVDQNFTANGETLMNAVNTIKFSAVQTNAAGAPARGARGRMGMGGGVSGQDQEQANIALRELLRALRDVAKMLGTAPGRKTLLFLSAGFNLTSERQIDFQETLDALNKANVGVYPVDPSGLTSMVGGGSRRMGSGTSTNPVLYALAAKTGGFPVVNTNDLQAGMVKVSAELNEYYLLGYVPPHPGGEGNYHKIHVKVDRAGAEVRTRNGYSDSRSPDLLAGKNHRRSLFVLGAAQLIAEHVEAQPAFMQHLGGKRFVLPQQSQQQVLRPDMFVREALRLFRREGKHALALLAQRQVNRSRDFLARRRSSLNLFTDGLNRSVGAQKTVRQRLIFAQQSQQQVLGFDIGTAELAGFVTGEKDHATCLFRIPLKHSSSVLSGTLAQVSKLPGA